MHYLIQKNVFADPRYDQIFEVMEELCLSYEIISFLPNSNTFNFSSNRKDVFVYGSVKLAKVAKNFDWHPGSFYGGNHETEKYVKGFGKHCFNFGSFSSSFASPLDWSKSQSLFIKPSKDAKVFTGKIFHQKEWEDFVFYSLQEKEHSLLNKNTAIQVSLPHTIIKEARVWIIDQQIITSSYYRFHGDIPYEDIVEEQGLDFVHQMTTLFQVADAYVMDICLTLNGWKIMEVNCINSAGFYKANVKEIILALEQLYTK